MKAILPLLAMAAAVVCTPAGAHDYRLGDLHVAHPTSRPAAKGMNGVGYLSVTNSGDKADVLLAVETPVAAKAEIHASSTAGGVARMSRLEGGLPIPAKDAATLETGGTHIMLVKLKRTLTVGDRVPATLVFRDAGRLKVEFAVERGTPDHHAH
ncbi:MAG TPA: copper chaperone PCu(A)C [Caulobacteraceae bacterium]|nr:copper chaperone PCu(A)C [Caulobacteraceae bacterium]